MILRYTDKVQKLLGSKVKPEPWLHCIISLEGGSNGKNYNVHAPYAIYVWDTRQVVEDGVLKRKLDGPHDTLSPMFFKLQKAKDNHQPLKGLKLKGVDGENIAVTMLLAAKGK